jgi:hypothetical protein
LKNRRSYSNKKKNFDNKKKNNKRGIRSNICKKKGYRNLSPQKSQRGEINREKRIKRRKSKKNRKNKRKVKKKKKKKIKISQMIIQFRQETSNQISNHKLDL